MDHLSENLENLSTRTGPRSPLFGSLSYFYSEFIPPIGGSVVTVMSGALHGEDVMPLVNPLTKTITLPVGQFTLTAFDQSLEFGQCLGTLRDWIRENELKIERKISNEVRAQTKNEDEFNSSMATFGGGLALVAKIEFIDE